MIATPSVDGSPQSQKNQTRTITQLFPLACSLWTSPGKKSKESRKRQWAYAQPRLVRPDADHQRWEKSTGTKAHTVRCQLQMTHGLSMDKYTHCNTVTRSARMSLLLLRRRAPGQSRSQPGSSGCCSPTGRLPNAISLPMRARVDSPAPQPVLTVQQGN